MQVLDLGGRDQGRGLRASHLIDKPPKQKQKKYKHNPKTAKQKYIFVGLFCSRKGSFRKKLKCPILLLRFVGYTGGYIAEKQSRSSVLPFFPTLPSLLPSFLQLASDYLSKCLALNAELLDTRGRRVRRQLSKSRAPLKLLL